MILGPNKVIIVIPRNDHYLLSIVVLLEFMLNFATNLYDHISNVLWECLTKFEINVIFMEYPKAFLCIPLYYNIMQHVFGS